jgi:hypothetical protein
MTDLVEAARAAIFAALDAALPDVLVRDHIEQNTQPDYLLIGEIDWDNQGSKDDPLLAVTVELIHVYRGGDRPVMLGRMHVAYETLEGATIEADGVVLNQLHLEGGSASTAGPDGVTYAGLQSFSGFVQPA